jgi:succinate dehydrogenase/fumarate reductase flavoprotein subunit
MGKDPEQAGKTAATRNQSCAAEFVPTFTNTQGGPRRNRFAPVPDTNRRPIPGLYAAGELGPIYSYHHQGGGNISECIVFGRIAGERAAAEKPWS